MELCQKNALIIVATLFQQHQMVNTKVRRIIFFAAKYGETVYSQEKQDRELTVAQIMNSLFQNSDKLKIGKATRLFRYDLKSMIVDVTNKFKGLDLIKCLKNYGQRFITL